METEGESAKGNWLPEKHVEGKGAVLLDGENCRNAVCTCLCPKFGLH